MIAGHGPEKDGHLGAEALVPLEVTEAGSWCSERRSGQSLAGDGADVTHVTA